MESVAAKSTPESYWQFVVLGLAVVAAALTVGWLLVRGNDHGSAQTMAPTIVSQSELEHFAARRSVYWAGPRSGYSYELTATPGGRVYVRYLPKGVRAGDERADFLGVGTYPSAHPYANLRKAAGDPGVISKRTADGGLVVVSERAPTSVYLAHPDSKLQVEVYEPDPTKALGLVLSGSVVPVG